MRPGRLIALVFALAACGCHGQTAITSAGGPARTAFSVYQANVVALANANNDYRRVIDTGQKTQLVLMSLPVGGDIGEETHQEVEQVFFCAGGQGRVTVNGAQSMFGPGDVLIVPPGIRHNVTNVGNVALKIYTLYAPPNHLDGRVQATKTAAQADHADEEFGNKVELARGSCSPE